MLKADLLFTKKDLKIPIEITTAPPTCLGSKRKRSAIKSYEIIARFYYFIKWFHLHKTPSVLVLDKRWKEFEWTKKEIQFGKIFKINILFTSFNGNWACKIAADINKIVDIYL